MSVSCVVSIGSRSPTMAQRSLRPDDSTPGARPPAWWGSSKRQPAWRRLVACRAGRTVSGADRAENRRSLSLHLRSDSRPRGIGAFDRHP